MPVLILIHAEHKRPHINPRTEVANVQGRGHLSTQLPPLFQASLEILSKQVQITFIYGIQSIAASTAKMTIRGEQNTSLWKREKPVSAQGRNLPRPLNTPLKSTNVRPTLGLQTIHSRGGGLTSIII
jgi:hypothetical protein